MRHIGMSAFFAFFLCAAAVGCSPSAGQPTVAPTVLPARSATPTPATEEVLAQANPPACDLAQIARRMGTPVAEAPTAPPAEAACQVGDRMEFWVLDTQNNTYRRATATLLTVTPHLYMWLEDGAQAEPEDLEASADYFEGHIYSTLHQVIGREWSPGIDGDPHLFVFNGDVPGASGYFYSPDEYPVEANPYSNQREIFFINLQAAHPGTEGYNGLLAHEFQHMIHWRNDPNEDAWVNEGLSELAMRVAGLPVSSLTSYTNSPDIQLNDWPSQGQDTGPHYGGGYLLMEYLLGRFGEGFLQQVLRDPGNGIAGIERALAQHGLGFDAVFRDWTAANLLNDSRMDDGVYGYANIHVPTPEYEQRIESLPAVVSDTVHPFGADYIQIPPSESVRVEFAGPTEASLAPFPARPGDRFWWSGRGDNSNMTLTREIDLTDVSAATLRASLWYAIEDGWDFAYLSVSTDGGETWLPQAGQHTRAPAPGDSMLGPGYTGLSGGGSEPAWIEESYSLNAFAGRNILIRFDYVTDDSVNGDGLWIRSVEIPELNWRDEAESAEGWQAEGFVRVENVVPQRFLVTAVLHGPETEVLPLEVGADGRGSARLNAPHGATLIVSSMARHTRQAAPYQLHVE